MKTAAEYEALLAIADDRIKQLEQKLIQFQPAEREREEEEILKWWNGLSVAEQMRLENGRFPHGHTQITISRLYDEAHPLTPSSSGEKEVSSADREEIHRMQLAGISTAAQGYFKDGDSIHPDYDTVALRDVVALYKEYDRLYKIVAGEKEVAGEVIRIKMQDGDKYLVTQENGIKTAEKVGEVIRPSAAVEKGEDEAIAFAEWIKQYAYHHEGCWYLHRGMSGEIYTIEQLYKKFKSCI